MAAFKPSDKPLCKGEIHKIVPNVPQSYYTVIIFKGSLKISARYRGNGASSADYTTDLNTLDRGEASLHYPQ
jgi:hypothetical protein